MFDSYDEANSRLTKRFPAGKAQEDALVAEVARTVIVDRLVPVDHMGFCVTDGSYLQIRYDGYPPATIHRHALGQLCQKARLPMNYTNALLSPEHANEKLPSLQLLTTNLRELFAMKEFVDRSGSPARFLHRIVSGELRGFLSSRFNRHLASLPLLKSFRDVCEEMGARAIEATSSPVRSSLKCLLPNLFEAFPGEYVGIGTVFSNSDFGAGKLAICHTVWRAKTHTSAILDEVVGRVHLGSVLTDSDLEVGEETMHKEVAAQCSAIRDAVTAQLAEKTVERLLLSLRAAHEEQIPWTKLRGRLAGILTKSDLAWLQQEADHGGGIVDLPPVSFNAEGERVPNAYWAAAALGVLASKAEDPDRVLDLQQEAGKLLGQAT